MESKGELKETDIENCMCYCMCMCYYFDDIIRFWGKDINFSNILLISVKLLDENLCKEKYENILIYNILYKTLIGAKLLCIRFIKIDAFIKIHDEIRYLVLVDYSYCDKIWDKIKYLISKKSGVAESINYNFARMRIDSFDSLPIEKTMTFYNVIILIKSVFNRNKNEYYYNIFL